VSCYDDFSGAKPFRFLTLPMPRIGKACHELRVQDAGKTWRIVYHVDTEAIVILEVFSKTTAKTPKPVIDACMVRLQRYKAI